MRSSILALSLLPLLACSPATVPTKTPDPAESAALPKAPASKPQFEWIRVEGGSFQMGHPQVSSSLNAQVKVDTFEITKSEVTVEQYRACVEAGKCTAPHADCDWNSYEMGDNLPVNCVTPDQAAQLPPLQAQGSPPKQNGNMPPATGASKPCSPGAIWA